MNSTASFRLPTAWADLIASVGPDPDRMCRQITDALPSETIPSKHLLLRAYEEVDPQSVKVLILGQDPYPTPGHACGLAFAVTAGCSPLPRSLGNIYKEISREAGPKASCDILAWPRQGVLLLNRSLSLSPGRELQTRWDELTGFTHLALILKTPNPLVVMGWGAQAIGHLEANGYILAPDMCNGPRLFLRATHPSPLSANRATKNYPAFAGCGHFKKANEWLAGHGQPAIDW